MNKIKFAHNWNNKLSLEVFTTIRKWDKRKEVYYNGAKGQAFQVLLDNRHFLYARLINVDIFRYEELPYGLFHIDTGFKTEEEIDKLFKQFGIHDKDFCIILTFEKI